LFAVGVIIIVGNTIRLDIENRRPEIEVTKLIGGTDAFIRRPFLYTGLWYGIGGGMMAWLLVSTALWLMQGPVARLSGLYGSEFQLSGLDGGTIAGLFAAGALLGWLGSWVAVARHLSRIEPA
jgi:cell division transport system permease protein